MSLTLTEEQANELYQDERPEPGETPLFEEIARELIGRTRWGTSHRLIFRERATGVLYALDYTTQSGDESDTHFNSLRCPEVERTEVTVIKYTVKKKESPIAAWPSKSTSSSTPLPQPAESSSTPTPGSVKPT